MKISQQGIDLIKHCESLHDGDLSMVGLQPKQDPVGILTIGYGHALKTPKGEWIRSLDDVKKYHPAFLDIDELFAERLLEEDVMYVENWLNKQESLLQNEFDALVSFAFNCGLSALEKSTLWSRVKSDATAPMITDAFLMWNKSGGKSLAGLTNRRKSEAMLFNTGKLIFYN